MREGTGQTRSTFRSIRSVWIAAMGEGTCQPRSTLRSMHVFKRTKELILPPQRVSTLHPLESRPRATQLDAYFAAISWEKAAREKSAHSYAPQCRQQMRLSPN
jgi:hypothetical protein